MLSTEVFFPSERNSLLQQAVNNEVPGNRDIRTVIEKLLIGQENKSDVRCPHNVCLY